MGVLYTVSLPWCCITLYHTEWVNMILNYSFLCHAHFFFNFGGPLSIYEVCNCRWKRKPRSICLELDFYVKLWRSTYLLRGLGAGMSKSSLRGHWIISFDQSNQVSFTPTDLLRLSKGSEPFRIMSVDFSPIVILPKIMWVRDSLAKWK